MRLRPVCLCLSLLAWSASARAEITRFAEIEGFTRLLEGDPTSVALSEEGAIGLRPRVRERFFRAGLSAGVAGRFGTDVVLTRLKPEPALVAVDKAGKERVLWPLGNRLVTRLAADGAGLWAATTEGDKSQLTVWSGTKAAARTIEVDARFVWDILPDGRGGALIATGEPGTVSKVDAKGRTKTLFSAEESHLKALLSDDKLGLFAGGGERGIVYVAEDGGKRDKLAMRALFDTGNQEVTSLKSDGSHVFVASVSGQVPSPSEPDPGAGGNGPAAGPMPHAGRKPEVRSTLVKVSPEGAGEMLAASNDEVLFDLAFDQKGRLLVATGAVGKGEPRGRLYRVETRRKQVSLLYQSTSKRITQLLPEPDDVVLVEQEGTRLVTLARDNENAGDYLGPTIDTGVVSRFGLVQVLGEVPTGSSARVSVRTGQTSEPDATWSSFGPTIEAPGNAAITVPNGRYAQVRLQLKASGDAQPQIYKIRLAYLRQNLPPFVQDIFALPHGQAMYALPAGATGDDGHSKVVPLAGKAEDAEGMSRKMPPRARQVAEPGAMTLRWTVDEPNGDDLEYALLVRGAGEANFRMVAEHIEEPFHTFHSAQLPDGWYTFRVRACDARSNPEALARTDQRDSRAILIDNTPPVFRGLKAGLQKGRVVVSGSVSDRHSPLTALEMAIDGGPFRPVLPRDGLLDGLREDLQVEVDDVQSGAHTVTLRSRDESGNVGHAFVRFEGTGKRK